MPRAPVTARPGPRAWPGAGAPATVAGVSEANWAGNCRYRAGRLHRPSTLEQVQELVAGAPRVRVLGSRHSFTDIADSAELLTLDGPPAEVAVDHAAGPVAFGAALRYGQLAEALRAEGVIRATRARTLSGGGQPAVQLLPLGLQQGRFVSCRVAACAAGGRLRCSAQVKHQRRAALPTSQYTNLPPLVEDPAVELAKRHTKVRREGYRRRQPC